MNLPKMMTIDPSAEVLPPWAEAAVYFVKDAGEYIFAARKDGQSISKFVRPVDVAAAFAHQENDTGWIDQNIVRIGNSTRGEWFIYRRGVAKIVCKIGIWNVRNVTTRSSNTRMAKQRLAANDTDVINANTATHQRRKYTATAPRCA